MTFIRWKVAPALAAIRAADGERGRHDSAAILLLRMILPVRFPGLARLSSAAAVGCQPGPRRLRSQDLRSRPPRSTPRLGRERGRLRESARVGLQTKRELASLAENVNVGRPRFSPGTSVIDVSAESCRAPASPGAPERCHAAVIGLPPPTWPVSLRCQLSIGHRCRGDAVTLSVPENAFRLLSWLNVTVTQQVAPGASAAVHVFGGEDVILKQGDAGTGTCPFDTHDDRCGRHTARRRHRSLVISERLIEQSPSPTARALGAMIG